MTNQPPFESLPSPLPPDGVAQSLEAEGKLPPTLDYADANKPKAGSVGHRTSVGVLWLILQTLGNRLVGIGSQIALAWLLRPDDFGIIGMAYTITTFTSVVVNLGLDQVLVHRQRRFALWANPAFWMSATFALVTSGMLVAIAPLAAGFYHEKTLIGVIGVMAASSFLTALALVPSTALQAQMRFKLIAILGFVGNLSTVLLTLLFAWRGFGAYSFVLPVLITSALILVYYWWGTQLPIRLNPQWRRWRYLIGDSAYVFLSRILWAATSQGDYITLGFFYGKEKLGIYYFAFNLSTLVMRVLAGNVGNVLFPAFTQFQQDVNRMFAGAFRATTLLTTVAVPGLLLQVLLAGPCIHLFFQPRWWGAVALVQILSIGWVIGVAIWPAGALIQAQGRFKAMFGFSICNTVLFALLIIPLIHYRQAMGGAVANLIYSVLSCLVVFGVMTWGRKPWWYLLQIIAAPLIAGAAATAACLAMHWALATMLRGRPLWSLELVLIPLVLLTVYAVALRLVDPTLWREIHQRVSSLLAARRPSRP